MKSLKSLFSFLYVMVLVLFLSCVSCAAGRDHPSVSTPCPTKDIIDAFVEDEIKRAVAENSVWCCWDESTEWFHALPLYDYNDNCNGYVYKMRTNGVETGYMQINIFEGQLSVGCSSFAGKPAYEGLADNTMSQIYNSASDKLYFFGGMTYCVKTGPDTFKAIDDVEEVDLSTVKAYCDAFHDSRRAAIMETAVQTASEPHRSSNLTKSFSLVTMSDFSNLYATRPNGTTKQRVCNHCSPTAATNIMLFFRSTGASPLSSSVSNSTIFMELYYAMDTNAISSSNTIQSGGTPRENIEPGIRTFCEKRSCSSSELGIISNINLSGIKSRINNGSLLLMSLNDFGSSEIGHSVAVFDYSGDSLDISTGWDTEYHKYAYSDLSIAQYVYIEY